MKYKKLKGSGLEISEVGLGTLTFGEQVNQKTADEIVGYAYEHGVTYFDTADVYVNGQSEEILGNSIKDIRNHIILASKVGLPTGKGPNEKGLSRKRIVESVEKSLKRLQTDYLDIYFLHVPDSETPLEETLDAANDLVRSGKIRYYAVSNYAAWQIGDAVWTAKERRLAAPIGTQNVYNLLTRDIERELVPYVNAHEIGLLVYNPIAGGLLSGKYKDIDQFIRNTRFDLKKNYQERYWNIPNFEAVKRLSGAAEVEGLSILEFSLKWIQEKEYVTSTILGVSKLEQLKQNLAVYDMPELSERLKLIADQVWDDLSNKRFQYNR